MELQDKLLLFARQHRKCEKPLRRLAVNSTFGYMLFRGRDDKPELYCGLENGRAVFARPMFYWNLSDARKDWEMLETTLAYNDKVELLQICDGWTMFERNKLWRKTPL